MINIKIFFWTLLNMRNTIYLVLLCCLFVSFAACLSLFFFFCCFFILLFYCCLHVRNKQMNEWTHKCPITICRVSVCLRTVWTLAGRSRWRCCWGCRWREGAWKCPPWPRCWRSCWGLPGLRLRTQSNRRNRIFTDLFPPNMKGTESVRKFKVLVFFSLLFPFLYGKS